MNIYLQILSMGFTSAIVGSLLTWGITSFSKRREEIRQADYSAIRLSVDLDKFAYACADDISETISENRGRPINTSNVPVLEFADTIAWISLDLPLVQRALSIQSDRRKVAYYLTGKDCDPDDLVEESINQVSIIGYRAHQLAEDVRKKYPKSAGTPNIYPWDHIHFMRERHDKAAALYAALRADLPTEPDRSFEEIFVPPAPPQPLPPSLRSTT